MHTLHRTLLALSIALLIATTSSADEFPEIVNSQKAGEHPPSPQEAAAAMKVPEGFQVTLFAGEPDVAQPIDMEFDDRGRIWVAECYSYNGRNFAGEHRDRIVILEDVDNDGEHDKRTVFWDEGRALTSLCYGFGGMYILNNGTLSHLPDANGDDQPDGPPQVLLDGFDIGPVGHNIVNGLMWGPDGWLYGRHGIQATSYVGKPGDTRSKRTALNCSIWRYHPQREKIEVVCQGTTNPWGLDYDAHGQFFFTNNVIGHLWHVIPGARYKRMYGEHFNPHLYALIDQTADHYHWEHAGGWTNSRLNDPTTDKLGGGHSHCGGMIYQGDNWPEEYRGGMFMCNTHGRRVNHDRLVREGSSYVGKHEEDFLHAGQPWFRGVSMKYGPDGGVYLSDWSDLGECHDHDGVHRTSGRIYKITYGETNKNSQDFWPKPSELPDNVLLGLLNHSNQWYVRRARRVLTERAVRGDDMSSLAASLRASVFDESARKGVLTVQQQLDCLWTLHCIGLLSAEDLAQMLDHESEHMRLWGIKLLLENEKVKEHIIIRLAKLAKSDQSGLVRLYLASALQKLPLADRWQIATNLASHEADAQDHHLRLMLWYGIEPTVVAHPDEALKFMQQCKWPLLQQYVARRLTYEVEQHPQPVAQLYEILLKNDDTNFRREVLTGMVAALSGRRQVAAPASWEKVSEELLQSDDPTIVRLTNELAVVHGSGRAVDQLLQIVADNGKPFDQRRSAIEVLATARSPELPPILLKLVGDKAMSQAAIRGLAGYDEPKAAQTIINRYARLRQDWQREAIATLSARPGYARELLAAVAAGKIPASDISAFHARQMQSLDEPEITRQLTELWGALRTTPAEKRELIEAYRTKMTDDALAKADLGHGRQLFQKTCANCHTLYGVGENIGPDLTGSNRNNLDYLLENILDPSALVATQFRMSTLQLASGQVVTGVIVQETEQILTVQTEKERLNIERSEVEAVKQSPLSLMPDGLIKNLSEADVRDLFGYLQGEQQVELPAEE